MVIKSRDKKSIAWLWSARADPSARPVCRSDLATRIPAFFAPRAVRPSNLAPAAVRKRSDRKRSQKLTRRARPELVRKFFHGKASVSERADETENEQNSASTKEEEIRPRKITGDLELREECVAEKTS